MLRKALALSEPLTLCATLEVREILPVWEALPGVVQSPDAREGSEVVRGFYVVET